MSKSGSAKFQSIGDYIKNGATILNTFFLLLHIFFGLFFYANGTAILFYYNFLSIAIGVIGYVLLYRELSNLYSAITNIEIFVFMILCTLCLGWEYGFQQYCMIFVVSLLFTDYSLNKDHKLRKNTICMLALVVIAYFSLRVWTFSHPYVYKLPHDTSAHTFYVVNSFLTFVLLMTYSYLYSQIVLRLELALVDAATKDSLTGLYNRRKMQDLLNAMSELLISSSPRICIAMIDIDNFKRINDTYGHDAGDEVLKTMANVLLSKNSEDTQDTFYSCRWGGEEFLIFYRTEHSDKEIISEFEALRQEITEQTIVYNDNEIKFSATIGLAFYRDGLTITEMVNTADEMLYKGKRNTKNIVVW